MCRLTSEGPNEETNSTLPPLGAPLEVYFDVVPQLLEGICSDEALAKGKAAES
jgi:hypothetical protein